MMWTEILGRRCAWQRRSFVLLQLACCKIQHKNAMSGLKCPLCKGIPDPLIGASDQDVCPDTMPPISLKNFSM